MSPPVAYVRTLIPAGDGELCRRRTRYAAIKVAEAYNNEESRIVWYRVERVGLLHWKVAAYQKRAVAA